MSLKVYLEAIRTGKTFVSKVKLAIFLFLDKLFDARSWIINIVIENEDGSFFCRNLGDFFMYSTHRERELRPYFKTNEGETFVDIGANIGKYTLMVANKNRKSFVIAIEPYEDSVEMIMKNARLNNLRNIRVIKKVLLDKKTNMEFYVNTKNPARSSLFEEEITGQSKYVGEKGDKDFISKHITTTTLDEVVKKEEKVSLIKIDVQGAELDVLKGGLQTLKKFKPRIIFEAWDKERLVSIKSFLVPLGYSISQIDGFNYIAVLDRKKEILK